MNNPYDFMHSLGFGAKTTVSMKDNENLAIGFIAPAVLEEGTVVKLTALNTIAPVDAVTDSPIGVVVTSEEKADGTFRAVIQTQFQMLVKGKAITGAVAVGDILAATSFDATDLLMEYAPAGANMVTGIALSAGAVGEQIIVGILRTFYKV